MVCGVTGSDTILHEHTRRTTRVVQASKKITEKRLNWYGHAMRIKKEHSENNAGCGHTGERRRGWPTLRWKDASKTDMTEAGLKEDNTTNRAEWRNEIISYTCDPR